MVLGEAGAYSRSRYQGVVINRNRHHRGRTSDSEAKGRDMSLKARALEGIRVADFSMWWIGPFLTMLLADLGAEVIKIESVQVMDGWRMGSGHSNSSKPWEDSPAFNGTNRNKRGITLNLNDPAGLQMCKEIVK